MKAVLDNPAKRASFELQLSIAMDLELFVTTTYSLEGDGLCILKAYDMIEDVRKLGRSLHTQAALPNTAALLRSRVKLEDGVKFRQYWSEQDAPGKSGWYDGVIINKRPGHGDLCAVRFSNREEMFIRKSEELSFRSTILAHELPMWQEVVKMIEPAFEYIEDRLMDNCAEPYHMLMQHAQMRILKVCATAFIPYVEALSHMCASHWLFCVSSGV